MPTDEQFKETAKRLRTIVEYGVSGALVGDNEIARAAVACEMVIELRRVLTNLYYYCDDHDWGTIPVGKTIEAAEDLVRELRANA